jgi:hypothetical protein
MKQVSEASRFALRNQAKRDASLTAGRTREVWHQSFSCSTGAYAKGVARLTSFTFFHQNRRFIPVRVRDRARERRRGRLRKAQHLTCPQTDLLPMLLRTTHFCRVKPTSASFFSNLYALSPWGAPELLQLLSPLSSPTVPSARGRSSPPE